MIESGDVIGTQELFRTRQASLLDRTEDGCTVLDLVACFQRLEVCKLLINEGANPSISSGGSALAWACFNAHTSTNVFYDLAQLLAQGMESFDFFDEDSWVGGSVVFRGDAETIAWLLQFSNSTYQQQSLEECVLFALEICGITHQPDMARLVRTILKGREMDETLCGVRNQFDTTLLHHAARSLGELLTGIYSSRVARLEDGLRLIRDLVKGGSELHALTDLRVTPMHKVIEGYLNGASEDIFIYLKCLNQMAREARPTPLRTWLKQLKDSGVDLIKYGKKEHRFLECLYSNSEWRYWEHQKRKRWECVRSSLRLINFTYGPEPGDWKF